MIRKTATITVYDPEGRVGDTETVVIERRSYNAQLVYITIGNETRGVAIPDLKEAVDAVAR